MWTCIRCNTTNNDYNSKCTKCGDFKSKSVKKIIKDGDWTCPTCSDVNFASRTRCRKCDKPKSYRKDGDWTCSLCSDVNFASRTRCWKCGQDKNKNILTSQNYNQTNQTNLSDPSNQSNSTLSNIIGTAFSYISGTMKEANNRLTTSENNSNNSNNSNSRGIANSLFGTPNDFGNLSLSTNDNPYNEQTRSNILSSPSPTLSPNSQFLPVLLSESNSKCAICYDRNISIAFKTCGHMISCDVCCYAMDICPICRRPYKNSDILRIYM